MTWSTGGTLEHPARVALGVIDEGISALGEANLWSLSERELLGLRIAQEATLARLHAQVLATTREVDARGAAEAMGASCTAGWLRGRCGLHHGAAKREVQLAVELDTALPVLRAALAAGEVSLAHAQVVAAGIRALPAAVDAATRARGEAYLVGEAKVRNPFALGKLAARLIGVLDPDGAARLERDEAQRELNEEFTLVHRHDGGRGFRGQLTDEDGAFIDAALDVLAAPRPAEDGTPDLRPAAKRRADALMDLVRIGLRAPEMPWSGGEPVTVTVTTGPEHLTADTHTDTDTDTDTDTGTDTGTGTGTGHDRGFGFGHGHDRGFGPGSGAGVEAAGEDPVPPGAHLEDGTPLSPETTRRLGCDAWLVAAILDAHGAVLDIGRRSRIVPAPMRRAVIVRDGGCAFPGCGRPPRWCQAHHIWHWSQGGPTALDNLVLLCAHHHNVVHHHGWTVHLDQHRLPAFTPPPWIDPDQVPRAAWRPPLHLLL
jgi:hypothetical protein